MTTKPEPKEMNPHTSFHHYTTYLKKALNRVLTEKEIKVTLQAYITGVKVDEMLNKLEGK
jgi:hypothetical protein